MLSLKPRVEAKLGLIMHELSVAKSIVESVTDICVRDKIKKVKSITLEIGSLSGVVRTSMEFCWPMATQNSILDGSELIVNEIPLSVSCFDCNKITTPDVFIVACGSCGSQNVEIKSGQELNIKNLEVS